MTETTGNPGTVVLAAANGFLGRSLAKALKAQGYRVVGLVRHGREADAPGCDALRVWDGRTLGDWAQALDGAAAVVNLAGRTVDCIKTPENRRQILESRVDSVRVIGQACRAVPTPPPVWLQAGTAHIIGDPIPEDTLCDDDTPPP
ncbi:MAG: NAD-dependent epimerase/dehydratase family protein, partial [Planctomycetota bacterium]